MEAQEGEKESGKEVGVGADLRGICVCGTLLLEPPLRVRSVDGCQKNATYGEDLLHELEKLIPVDRYLSAEHQEGLRSVDSQDSLNGFLAAIGLRGVSTDGDIPNVAAHLASRVRLDHATRGLGLEGCLLIPLALQLNWLIDAFRMRRLRFGLAEILAFVALFAASLSYEISIAPVAVGMPQQLLLAVPVALLLGAFPSYFFKQPRWVILSFDLILLMEAIAFVVWCRS